MSARDKVHQHVVNSLRKDGWTITHDPLKVGWRGRGLKVDLGAEKLIAAEKETEKIAVEIKSFIGASELADLYLALGQFILYRKALRQIEPDRKLYLALDSFAYEANFGDDEGESLRAEEGISLVVFNQETEEVIKWKR
jgi:hypothetical protein